MAEMMEIISPVMAALCMHPVLVEFLLTTGHVLRVCSGMTEETKRSADTGQEPARKNQLNILRFKLRRKNWMN